jgi:hypothetical protein
MGGGNDKKTNTKIDQKLRNKNDSKDIKLLLLGAGNIIIKYKVKVESPHYLNK